MMPLICFSILALCLSVKAENMKKYQDSGEDVTLACSSAACSGITKDYAGMYLYHEFKTREEVFYYYPYPKTTDKITPRGRYTNRIQTNGSLNDHTITIKNLTVDDSGLYICSYIKGFEVEDQCNVHTLFVRGNDMFQCDVMCSSSDVPLPCAQVSEQSQSLVLIAVTTCALSILVTLIFVLLIIPVVKQWTSSRRTTPEDPQDPSDYVYEVMTKGGLRSQAAPERSPPSPYDLS